MQAGTWRGNVELLCTDGGCFGQARARLVFSPDGGETVRWRGELRAAILPTSTPWPADEPVRLRCANGEEFEVWLEPGVIDDGSVLLQVARVSTPERQGGTQACEYLGLADQLGASLSNTSRTG